MGSSSDGRKAAEVLAHDLLDMMMDWGNWSAFQSHRAKEGEFQTNIWRFLYVYRCNHREKLSHNWFQAVIHLGRFNLFNEAPILPEDIERELVFFLKESARFNGFVDSANGMVSGRRLIEDRTWPAANFLIQRLLEEGRLDNILAEVFR